MEALRRLYSSKEHSDITVVCGEKEWKLHKCILSASSKYFERVCKDTQFNELNDGVVTLASTTGTNDEQDYRLDAPEMVEVMLKFVYTGDYFAKEKASPRSSRTVLPFSPFGKRPTTPSPPPQKDSSTEQFKFGEPVAVFGAPPASPTPAPKDNATDTPVKTEEQVSVFATVIQSTTTTPKEKTSTFSSTTQDQVSVFATTVRSSTPPPPKTTHRPTKDDSPFANMVRPRTPPPSTTTPRKTDRSASPITPKSTPSRSPQREAPPPLSAHAKMFSLGSKYDIPALRKQAVTSFVAAATVEKVHGPDLAEAILIAFNTGSDEECQMRDCVFDTLMAKILTVARCAAVKEAIARTDGLAMRVLEHLVRNLEPAAAAVVEGN